MKSESLRRRMTSQRKRERAGQDKGEKTIRESSVKGSPEHALRGEERHERGTPSTQSRKGSGSPESSVSLSRFEAVARPAPERNPEKSVISKERAKREPSSGAERKSIEGSRLA